MILPLLLILLYASNIYTIQFDTQESKGILFEKITKVYTTHKHWNIIYYFNLHNLHDTINTLKTNVLELNKSCMAEKMNCKKTIEHINDDYNHLVNEERLIDTLDTTIMGETKRYKRNIFQTPPNNNKQKRSMIKDFISSTIYDEEVNEALNTLKENIVNTKIISKEQLTLINKTASLYNNSFFTLDEKLKNLTSKINSQAQENSEIATKQKDFDELAAYITYIIKVLNKISKFITKTILKTSDEHLLKIISLDRLNENIETITPYLQPNEKIPIKTDNKLNILKIISYETILTSWIMMLKIKIPIVDNEEKFIHTLTTIPIKRGNALYLVKPLTQYAILDTKLENYTPLTTMEYNKCINADETLICETSYPTYYDNLCELSILRGKQVETECSRSILAQKNYITPLKNKDTFFITIKTPIEVELKCSNSNSTKKTLETDGILSIPQGCELISQNFHIKTRDEENHTYNTPVYIEEKPQTEKVAMDEEEYYYEDENDEIQNESIALKQNIEEQLLGQSEETTDRIKIKKLRSKTKSAIILTITVIIGITLYLLNRKYDMWNKIKNTITFFCLRYRS